MPPGSKTCDASDSPSFHNLITQNDAKALVHRVLGPEASLSNYSLRSYCDGKLGFLGSHWRVCVEAKVKDQIRTLQFFAKSVPYEVPIQAEYVVEKGVFQQEIEFYCNVIPELYKNYNGKPWSPECYLVKNDVLVFEDLGIKGYSMRHKLFDEELMLAGYSALARMHASSLIAEARLGKSLKCIFPDAFKEVSFSRTGPTNHWFQIGVDVAVAIAEQAGLPTTFLRDACDQIYDALEESPTKANVATHGDLWANNLLFNNDEPPNCRLVDFQLLRYAPLANDVAQFLYLCTDRSFRKIWERTMLEHYYKELCDTLKSSSVQVKIPPWSEILQGMEEQRLCGVITAVVYFPTVLLDETLGAQIMNDPVRYEQFVFQNRTNAVIENMKNDVEYGRRLKEAVFELQELSLKLNELPKPT